jgi:hypothetical protein
MHRCAMQHVVPDCRGKGYQSESSLVSFENGFTHKKSIATQTHPMARVRFESVACLNPLLERAQTAVAWVQS